MFSNNQHETPKKIHTAPLRIGRKTQETRPLPTTRAGARPRTHARTPVPAHRLPAFTVNSNMKSSADGSFMFQLLYGRLMLISWLMPRVDVEV